MINKVKVNLPYPVRVGFFSINRTKKVWLSFDNLSLFLFQQEEKIGNSDDLKAWNDKHGKFDLFVYGAFYAAKAYAMHNTKKFDLNFKKFAFGLANLPENEMKELTEVWQWSQSYGHADLPGKKKSGGGEAKPMSYAEQYAYCIGQCGIKPAEFWKLTEAETIGIIAGHQRLESYDAEKLRNIYGAMVRFMGEKKDVKLLWPLPTDYDNNGGYSPEYIKERNEKAMILADKLGIFKN